MKQSTLLVAAATSLLLSSSAVAQTTIEHGRGTPREYPVAASAAAVEYRVIDSLGNAFSYYSTNAEPVKYDPLLNILATIKRGNPTQSGNKAFIYASTDLGMTWSAPMGPLFDNTAAGFGSSRYPSLVINPTHSTNASEYFYFYTVPILTGPSGGFGGFATGLVGQNGADVIPAQASQGVGDATWGSDSRSIETAGGDFVVSVQSIDGNAIAVRRLDLNAGTISEWIPEQFAGAMFSPTEEGFRSSTTGGIGRDANGSIHAMIWARTPETDAAGAGDSMAMPLMSKSTDGGATWSTMAALPGAMLRDYALGQGFTPVMWTTSYGPTGFAVTGLDRASMVFAVLNQDTTNPMMSQIVEARYNAGNWGVFKVADFVGWYTMDNGGGDFSTQVENEIQMAMTADGQTLVAKWTDAVSYLYAADINGDGEGDDTLGTTDVFVATRAVNQGTWSDRKNVTETPILDRLTWMPINILPNDLSRLPIISVQTIPDAVDATIQDQMFNGQRVLVDRRQYVVVTNVDAVVTPGAAPIVGEVTASTIASITPNPTSGSAVVTLGVAKGGYGSVEIFSSLGQRVATLASGMLQAGTHSYNLDGVELPAGAYYVAMKIDGQTVTSPFSVVR